MFHAGKARFARIIHYICNEKQKDPPDMPLPRRKRLDPRNAQNEFVQLTVRVQPADADFLLDGFTFANQAATFYLHAMRLLLSDALCELQGFFSPQEWEFLALTLKGIEGWDEYKDVGIMLSKSDLCRVLLQARHLPARATLCEVIPSELVRRIRENLSPLHVWAIRKRVRDYWRTPEADMSVWARF